MTKPVEVRGIGVTRHCAVASHSRGSGTQRGSFRRIDYSMSRYPMSTGGFSGSIQN